MSVYKLGDFLNDINQNKENILKGDEQAEKDFSPFIVLLMLSYHPDTVGIANELNCRHGMNKRMQYDFLIRTVRKGKRWSRIGRPPKNDDVQMLMEYYCYSEARAVDTLRVISEETLEDLRKRTAKGGRK